MKRQQKQHYKSQQVIPILLILLLSTQVQAIKEENQVKHEFIELKQELRLLPSDPTNEQFCNDSFLESTYAKLSLTLMDTFKIVGEVDGIDTYRQNLEKIQTDIFNVQEKLNAFLTLQIQAKRILSPTYRSQIENTQGQVTQNMPVVSKEFIQRLHLDKEIYYLTIKTQQIVTNYITKIGKERVVQEYTNFGQFFQLFGWLVDNYTPTMWKLILDMNMIENSRDFTAVSYRFWSIRMYLTARNTDETTISSSIQYLRQLQDQSNQGNTKLTYSNSNNFTEILIYACDLYAALLFEFQLLIKSNESVLDKQFDADIELYEFISENYNINDPIEGLPVCQVAIDPQDHFITNILGLTIFFPDRQWDQRINFQKIAVLLETEPLLDYNGELYDPAIALYEFDMYIIDHLIKRKLHQRSTIEEMRIIFQQVTTHMKKTNHSGQQVDIVYEITIQFLQYLVDIQENENVKAKITPQGIERSIRMQYIIFTLLRLNALNEQEDIYQSYDFFFQKFKLMFLRNMNPEEEDFIIEYIGREEWEVTLVITIEIITIMFENGNTDYMKTIYENIGGNFKHIKIQEFKENGLNDETLKYVRKYTPITDKDFTYIRIIYRVFITDQIDEIIEYIHASHIDNRQQHLKRKKMLFKVLIELQASLKTIDQSDQIKQLFISKLDDSKLNQGEDKKFLKDLKGYIQNDQNDYYQIYRQVYIHMYKYISLRIYQEVEMSDYSLQFLDFLLMFQERDDVQVKYATSTEVNYTQYNLNLLLDIVSGEDDGQCTYEEKWNEDMLVDSLLVYPWILVKHRETLFSGEICQDYNPTLMTRQEAEIHDPENVDNDQQRDEFCINQREEKFYEFGINLENLQEDSVVPSLFIQSLIFSPELYIYSEQIDFMIDSFQVFTLLQKYSDQRILNDEQIQNIFIDIYKFIIHIRSDPNFVYDGNYWELLMSYIHKCMQYQRYQNEDPNMYFCHYGYARYNEMYWFLHYAELHQTGSFENMQNALATKPEVQNKANHPNPEELNWGIRTNARFNQFVHYILQTKIINRIDVNDLDSSMAEEENNWKLYLWGECSVRRTGNEALDFCKYLMKIAQIQNELSGEIVGQEKLNVVLQILFDDVQNDNDVIIAWEVLDFFQFEQDIKNGDIMEKIRKLFDKKVIDSLKSNPQQFTMSQIFKVTDINLLGDYAKSKYDENTTVRNQQESQYGLDTNKQDNALQAIITQILKSETEVKNFLKLNQNTKHDKIFKDFQMVHYIPLSLLLYYSDTDAEFRMISKVLVDLDKLDLLFLSDVDAGELIVKEFRAYMLPKFKLQSKDQQKYTKQNLIEFIGTIEKESLKGRKMKSTLNQNVIKGGLNFNVKETSKINVFKHSLLNGKLANLGGNKTAVKDGQINQTTIISDDLSSNVLNELNERSTELIKNNEAIIEVQDMIVEQSEQNKQGQSQNRKSISNSTTQKLVTERIINSANFVSENSLKEMMEKNEQFQNNQQKNINQSGVTIQHTVQSTVDPVNKINIEVHKIQQQRVKIIRKKQSVTTQGIVFMSGNQHGVNESHIINRLI